MNAVKSEITQSHLEEVLKVSGHFPFLFVPWKEVQQKVDGVGFRMIFFFCGVYCILHTVASCLLLVLERKGIGRWLSLE